MRNSKLISILQSLSKKEMKEFQWYATSPLFNKNQDVLNLLSILSKHYPNFLHPTLTHEKIAHLLFKQPDIQRLRYVMTDITKLAEGFISMKAAQKNPQKHLVHAYQERQLDKYFTQELKKQQKQLLKGQLRDEDYHHHLHELSELSFQHTLVHENRNIDTELQALVDHLDLFYLTKKLKYSCEIINRMNILNVSYDVQLLENLLDFLDEQQHIKTPSITTYYYVLNTLRDPSNQSHYRQLKQHIKKYLGIFQKSDQYDLFGYMQNYCIKRINSGDNEFLDELFNNYKEMIDSKVVIKENRIDQFDFKNIVTVALRVEAFDWTAQFIDQYQDYLNPEHAENAISYNKARLYFHQKEYKKSRRELLSVEFTDIYYSLDSRSLLLKTYYKMEDFEAALGLIDSFKIYLKRDKKISDYQKQSYTGFLLIVHKLVRYKLGYAIEQSALEKMLDSSKPIADSSWLKQQINQLK